MGASIFSEIVSEGLLQAGDTSLTTRANFALKKWLRSQAEGFLWPQLKGNEQVAVGANSEDFDIGAGDGGVTEEIFRINDPMKIWETGSETLAGMANIRVKTDWDDTLVNPFDGSQGKPTEARLKQNTTKGSWTVSFDHETDRAYTVYVNYYYIPADPATSAVPWYPNDRTMVQAVYVEALKYKKDPNYRNELDLLAGMVRQDRMNHGIKPGINDAGIPLNKSIFR